MLNLYHPMSILMLLQDFFRTFNEPQGPNVGFQNYSIWETSFQTCIFLYKKKYWTNIEFEKIMSDPRYQILLGIVLVPFYRSNQGRLAEILSLLFHSDVIL